MAAAAEGDGQLDTSTEDIRGLSCQICYSNFGKEGEHVPRNLQCGHTYCTACLSRLVGQYGIGMVRCPTCKYETLINGFMDDVNQLPKNFGVLEILSNEEERRQQPSMPTRPAPQPPVVQPPSADENNYAVYDSLSRGYERRCPQHENEPMKVFCKSCSEIICIYCQVYGAHKSHTCELITKTAEQGRREVISMSENLGRSKENLLLSRQIIIETISAVRHKEEKTIREITHHFDGMRKKVHKRESQLKDMVKCKTSQKICSLEMQERTISDLIDRCELTSRVCTRTLTDEDLAVVEEKDVLLHEMTALTDMAGDCELAPVCIDNITCYLPRDAFDVIMVHGKIQETESNVNDSLEGSGDAARFASAFGSVHDHEGSFMPPPENMDAHVRQGARPRSTSRQSRATVNAFNVPQLNLAAVQQAAGTSNISPRDLNLLRTSLERAFASCQQQQMIQSPQTARHSSATDQSAAAAAAAPQSARPLSRESAAAQSAREAAAQAAIKRSHAAQQVVHDYLATLTSSLENSVNGSGGGGNSLEMDEAMNANLTNIQNAMQEIQCAVTSARATLEDSMPAGEASGNPQSSPERQNQEVDEGDDGGIYEQVSDGDDFEDAINNTHGSSCNDPRCDCSDPRPVNGGTPSRFSNGVVPNNNTPANYQTNQARRSASSSSSQPVYHLYESSTAVMELQSDSSSDNDDELPNPENMSLYEECDHCEYCDGNRNDSCSCSECNSDGEVSSFGGIPYHLDLSFNEGEGHANFPQGQPRNMFPNQSVDPQIYMSGHQARHSQESQGAAAAAAASSASRRNGSNSEDVSKVTKLFNSLMKTKTPSKKNHRHKNAQRGSNQAHQGQQSSMSCSPFFQPVEAALSPRGGGHFPRTTPPDQNRHKARRARQPKTSTPPGSQGGSSTSSSKKGSYMFLPTGGSSDSLSRLAPAPHLNNGEAEGLAANGGLPCVNAGNYCPVGEGALFSCSYCKKTYCHNCALAASSKKCPNKPNKLHSIIPIDDDFFNDPNAVSANLNIPKNPNHGSVSQKCLLKCPDCQTLNELNGENKSCRCCGKNLQVDPSLYNACGACRLLNSKDNISCENCSADLVSNL